MYALDTTAAKSADSTGFQIKERGKYIGRFTRAEHIVSERTGTKGIDFDFVSDSGQRARFSVYTVKSDGTTIYGFKQLMAMMTVLKLRQILDPVMSMARVYDFDQGKEVEKNVPQFAELVNKPIGILITMEEYKPGKFRPNLAGVFQAETDLVASEILERKTAPAQLAKMVAALRDKPLKGGTAPDYSSPDAGHPADDSDIPF